MIIPTCTLLELVKKSQGCREQLPLVMLVALYNDYSYTVHLLPNSLLVSVGCRVPRDT